MLMLFSTAQDLSKIDYVDVCDDLDATKKLLEMHEQAQNADISVLIGMGSSPGVANLLAKFCTDHMLDEVESIDILHAHGGGSSSGRSSNPQYDLSHSYVPQWRIHYCELLC